MSIGLLIPCSTLSVFSERVNSRVAERSRRQLCRSPMNPIMNRITATKKERSSAFSPYRVDLLSK
jgi:hypothetical protein